MLTKLKSTHEALRKTAASLLDRARQAAADATAARSMAADSIAAGSDDAARTALTRAAVRAAEAEALTAAAGETEARAVVLACWRGRQSRSMHPVRSLSRRPRHSPQARFRRAVSASWCRPSPADGMAGAATTRSTIGRVSHNLQGPL